MDVCAIHWVVFFNPILEQPKTGVTRFKILIFSDIIVLVQILTISQGSLIQLVAILSNCWSILFNGFKLYKKETDMKERILVKKELYDLIRSKFRPSEIMHRKNFVKADVEDLENVNQHDTQTIQVVATNK